MIVRSPSFLLLPSTLAISLAFGAVPAAGCTVAGARAAAETHTRMLAGKQRLAGSYRIANIEPLDIGAEYPRRVAGVVTASDGRSYPTTHVDDGLIRLCAVQNLPRANADGIFYLERRGDSFELVHWTSRKDD